MQIGNKISYFSVIKPAIICIFFFAFWHRTSGVTQKDLCKTFHVKGNNFHFIVKSLASQRLIVRQSTIIKVKDNVAEGEEASRNKQVTNTNSLYLSRYAKDMNMNSHQRIEITKLGSNEPNEDTNIDALQEDGAFGVNFKNDISVHDYLPAMEAICDKLENASGKVNCYLFPFETLLYFVSDCTLADLVQLFPYRLLLCQT